MVLCNVWDFMDITKFKHVLLLLGKEIQESEIYFKSEGVKDVLFEFSSVIRFNKVRLLLLLLGSSISGEYDFITTSNISTYSVGKDFINVKVPLPVGDFVLKIRVTETFCEDGRFTYSILIGCCSKYRYRDYALRCCSDDNKAEYIN